MSNVMVFDFEGAPVRFLAAEGREAVVGADFARRLGIQNPRDAFARTPESEKGVGTIDTLGGKQEVVVLFEPGMYRMIFESRKPAAERLKAWVFNEVLPAIRKTGSYGRQRLSPKEAASAMAQVRLAERLFGKAHARALWREVGLSYVQPSPEDIAAVDAMTPARSAGRREIGRGLPPAVPVRVTATAEAVVRLLDRPEVAGEWSGTASVLLRELQGVGVKGLPETNQALGLAMVQARGLLQDRGISVGHVHSGVRRIIIRRESADAGGAA